jgi:hypothetical protein
MIKKIAILSLLLVYFTVTMGFIMSTHFCGGQITKVSFSTKKLFCGEKDMEMRCCHNKHVDIKVSDKHQTVTDAAKFQISELSLFSIPAQPFLFNQALAVQNDADGYRGPPLHSPVPLIISNSVFRI